MTLVQPSALWALVALPLILLLYILRPRHRRIVVPSVRLWQRLTSDLEGRPRWRLPVATLLLLAQLLTAAALAIALARPAFPGPVGQHLILVIDSSPTMLATDVAPNRLALAIQTARQLVAGLNLEDRVTLINAGPSPAIVATGKGPQAIDRALGSLHASPIRGDVQTALALAAQTADQSTDTHNRIVILSDGAFDPISAKDLGAIPADLSYQQIGGSDDNQAIIALSVRPMIGAANRYLGFAQIANFAHRDVTVGIQATADGLPIYRQKVTIKAREPLEISLTLPQGTHLFGVSIDAADKYTRDNHAETLVPSARPIPVTLVAADPTAWQRALKTLPNVQLKTVNPASYKPDDASVTIFDGFVPAALPSGSVILAAPPPGNPVVPVAGVLPPTAIVHVDESSPLLDSVDLSGLFIQQPVRLGAAPWARSIAESTDGPVMFDGTLNGRRMIIIGFDPLATDWPQRLAFPIFVANAIQSLVPAPLPSQIDPGRAIDLPPLANAPSIAVQLPDGRAEVFANTGKPIRLVDTGEVGRYLVSAVGGSQPGVRAEFVAQRLGIPDSDIAPHVDPQQLNRAGSPSGKPTAHEIWWWVAGGALGLLAVEWLIYYRRLIG